MALNSTNPVFKKVESEVNAEIIAEPKNKVATFSGVLLKTGILFLVAVASGALFVFLGTLNDSFASYMVPMAILAPLIAFVCALIGTFSIKAAPVTSVLFSSFIGISLGLFTALLEAIVPGIFITAMATLFIVFGITLLLYSFNAFKNKSKFYRIASITGLSLILVFLFSFILSFFIDYTAYLWIMVLVDGILIIYGAMMLVMDFDRATMLAKAEVAKKYEWQVSLGMMVSIVWIFIYILRFLVMLISLIGRRGRN